MVQPYSIPAGDHRRVETVKKSKFITTLAHAPTPAAAKAVIARLKTEFSDANHNCWAYVAGPPGDTAPCGMSDDGEPHGTAGRPMLNVLVHGDVGEIVAVVTRYFGGIKLGTGGLVRAYAGSVQNALATLACLKKQTWIPGCVVVDYKNIDRAKHLIAAAEANITSERYTEVVTIRYEAPEESHAELSLTLNRLDRTDSGRDPETA